MLGSVSVMRDFKCKEQTKEHQYSVPSVSRIRTEQKKYDNLSIHLHIYLLTLFIIIIIIHTASGSRLYYADKRLMGRRPCF